MSHTDGYSKTFTFQAKITVVGAGTLENVTPEFFLEKVLNQNKLVNGEFFRLDNNEIKVKNLGYNIPKTDSFSDKLNQLEEVKNDLIKIKNEIESTIQKNMENKVMNTTNKNEWKIGPLVIVKHELEDPQAKNKEGITIAAKNIQWSLNLRNVVWTIPEDVALKIIDDLEQSSFQSIILARQQVESCIKCLEEIKDTQCSTECKKEINKRLKWLLDKILQDTARSQPVEDNKEVSFWRSLTLDLFNNTLGDNTDDVVVAAYNALKEAGLLEE